MDLPRLTKVFLIPLLYISAWLGTLLFAPAFYARHRIPIMLAVRLLTGYTAGSTRADTNDMIYTTMNLSDPLGFGLKISLIAMPPMMVVEVAVLQLPFLLQAAAVLYKCSRLMYGTLAAELVLWGNNLPVLSSAATLSRIWASLIQPSGSAGMLLLPQHPRLAGRSSGVCCHGASCWPR
uniref:Uncharacterized protein n=1 Tax=Tetradesmus obliquus TaxID=3088 RepID=A0A383WLV6_TETOB|eukprot:jgi/Sobl393_1/8733/SZX78114.1